MRFNTPPSGVTDSHSPLSGGSSGAKVPHNSPASSCSGSCCGAGASAAASVVPAPSSPPGAGTCCSGTASCCSSEITSAIVMTCQRQIVVWALSYGPTLFQTLAAPVGWTSAHGMSLMCRCRSSVQRPDRLHLCKRHLRISAGARCARKMPNNSDPELGAPLLTPANGAECADGA
jgi:hypothetical protein